MPYSAALLARKLPLQREDPLRPTSGRKPTTGVDTAAAAAPSGGGGGDGIGRNGPGQC